MTNKISESRGFAQAQSLSYSFVGTAAELDTELTGNINHGLGRLPDSLQLLVDQGSSEFESHDPATYVLVSSSQIVPTAISLASVLGGATQVRLIVATGTPAISVALAGSGQAGIIASGGSQTISPALFLESNFKVGSSAFFVDVAEDHVGIGTATPSNPLHLRSTSGIPSGLTGTEFLDKAHARLNYASGSTSLFIAESASSGVMFQAAAGAGTVALGLHLQPYGGNVSIGTTSPTNPFHAKANLGIPTGLTGTEFLDKSLARFNFESGTGSLYVAAGGSSSVILQCANANGTLAQDVYLQPYGGSVGVGTTTPGDIVEAVGEDAGGRVRYQVRNTSTTAGSTAGYGGEAFNGTGGFFLGMESNSPFDVELRAFQGGADINFYSGGASSPTVVMEASGDVLIGTATNSGNAALQVENSNGGGLAANFYRSTSTGATDLVAMYSDVTTTRGEVWRVEADGDTFGSTGGTYTSDLRVKKNVTPIAYGLEEILQLDPISFNWQQDEEGEVKSFSLGSAQKVQELMPEMVSEDGLEYEIDGVRQKAKAIYGQEVVAVMVKAIQELKAENDALETRIAALETGV